MDHPTETRRGRPPSEPAVVPLSRSDDRLRDATPTDEASAEAARLRLRAEGIIPIEPDARVGVMLRSDEQLVAVRHAVFLERRAGRRSPEEGLCGDLYVTTQRLLHLGCMRVECPLGEIREAVVTDDALRLVVGDYRGITLRVEDPRVLRVEIAAAREAAREAGATIDAGPPADLPR